MPSVFLVAYAICRSIPKISLRKYPYIQPIILSLKLIGKVTVKKTQLQGRSFWWYHYLEICRSLNLTNIQVMNLTLASFKYFSNWDNANTNGFAMPINVKCQSPESGKHFVCDLVNVLDYHPKCECDLIKSHEKWQEAVLSFQHPWKHDSELLAKVIKISMDTLNLTLCNRVMIMQAAHSHSHNLR